jgi:hypothetical protein
LSQLCRARVLLAVSAIFLVSLSAGTPALANGEQQDAEALVGRLRELLQATESKMIIVPFPNSRSRILKADGNAEYFLYLERGNLRGSETIDDFYAKLAAGDMAGANDVFTRHSLVSLRISDYGWNGLGVPMMRQDGSDEFIADRLYKNNEGVFGAAEPTPEDAATYLEYIETILIPALEAGP